MEASACGPCSKKGDKSLAGNYRPLSLTCLIMKIFEIQIRSNLMSRCHHLLDPRQHAFLPEKSCTTQLASYVDSLSQSINASSRSDVGFFDFMKANLIVLTMTLSLKTVKTEA